MRYLILLFTISFTISSFSQNSSPASTGSIEGVVVEKSDKTPISSAIVKLLQQTDSSLIKGVATDEDGKFKLKASLQKQILEISYIGHHKFYLDIALTANKPSLILDTIYLQDNAILLQEAEVIADIPAMQIKGDTIEFNAGAYHIDGSTVLRDLIKQIPGLEMDENGALKANGKAITKILVDGKEYFGNDITMALTTLPANMITKLQLFEKESEEAKASGIRDDNPDQVLNLEVKEEFKKSTFGDTKSGIGNKGRHTNRFNANKMHGDNQFALVGDLNNINDSEYSYGDNFDDNISKSLGANFNLQKSEKLTINGNAKYDNSKNTNEHISDSYSSILDQYKNSSGNSVNKRQDMSAYATFDWKPDTLTTVFLRTSIGYNDGDNISQSIDSARIVNKSSTSSTATRFSESNSVRIQNSLMISRRLNNEGRNLTLGLSQLYNKNNSDGTNYSEKIYWEENKTDIVDQTTKNDGKSTGYGIMSRYVEPLSKDDRLYASYNISFNDSKRIGDIRKKDPITGEHSVIDTDYSRNTDSYSMRQSMRMGYQRSKDKYTINLSFAMDPSLTKNKTYLGDSIIEDLKQNVINFSPSIYLEWKPNKTTHIDFNYNGSTNHPSITELSADTVIHSPISKTVGNPNLKPSFDNRFHLSYRKSDYESGRSFVASMSYSYTFNSTVNYQLVDEHSNMISTYRNIDGNSSAYIYFMFNTPLKNKKINIGSAINTSFNRNIGFINEKKNTQDRVSLSPSVYTSMRFNFNKFTTDILETRLSFNVDHTIANNNLADMQKSNNTDYRLSHSMKLKLPLDDSKNLILPKKYPVEFAIESNLNFSYRSGLAEGIKKDETMWNLAVSMVFLKDKRGTLKFEYFDVLNDLRKQENTISGSDYSNYWRRVVNNYFIVSFAYRFNFLGGKS